MCSDTVPLAVLPYEPRGHVQPRRLCATSLQDGNKWLVPLVGFPVSTTYSNTALSPKFDVKDVTHRTSTELKLEDGYGVPNHQHLSA